MQRASSSRNTVLDLRVTRQADIRSRSLLVERLLRVADDADIKAVLLRIDAPPGGWAATGDLRDAILALREAGTQVHALLESPGNGAMYLASACDHVFIVPTGEVGLLGIGAELTFFGAALEKLGIKPDFEAAGAYKSFGEAYTRTFASMANQEAMGSLIEDLHRQLVAGIAAGRQLTIEEVETALEAAPLSAAEAHDRDLVDTLAYDDEVRTWLKSEYGEAMKLVGFEGWSRRDFAIQQLENAGEAGKSVAVVHLDGPIVMDRGGRQSNIKARRVVEVLRGLRKNDNVGAVVLNVNSPGGSALASDVMWREVELLGRDKPVVAVFEDVAASGGYYLAAPAAEIFARQGTLTGSIGVFGGKMVVGEGLRKLGVHTQRLDGDSNALVYSPTRPFNDVQRERFRASLQRFYDGFVQRVATGRKRDVDEVEPHCRGRVWTGADARQRGLVDTLGTLLDAVKRARELAELPKSARRLDIPTMPRRTLLQWVVQKVAPSFGTAAAVPPALARLAEAMGARWTPALELVTSEPGTPLALMPFEIELR